MVRSPAYERGSPPAAAGPRRGADRPGAGERCDRTTTLGLALGAVTVVSLALLPLTARLLDQGWRMRLLVPGMLLAAGAMLLYPAATTPWTFAVLLVVAGLTAGTAGQVPAVVLADVVHPGRYGRAVGILRTTGDLGAVLGPLTLGLVLDGAGAIWACGALATVAAGSALVHLGLARPLRRRLGGGDGAAPDGVSGRLAGRSTRRTSQESST
ncbi:MFS transporter [Actinotalea sp. C106]|uniref:MFS transporter n=1 Tax=Actinotalea sp. C106 TaxID=2908644 RepID=UPI002028CCDD|nr:MFS transporter [Actinotalea sp. C106]